MNWRTIKHHHRLRTKNVNATAEEDSELGIARLCSSIQSPFTSRCSCPLLEYVGIRFTLNVRLIDKTCNCTTAASEKTWRLDELRSTFKTTWKVHCMMFSAGTTSLLSTYSSMNQYMFERFWKQKLSNSS